VVEVEEMSGGGKGGKWLGKVGLSPSWKKERKHFPTCIPCDVNLDIMYTTLVFAAYV